METSGLDELFAEVAVKEQILTPAQVEECRKALEAASKIGLHASLYEVAADKGFVSKHEVLNLLSPLIRQGGRPRLGGFDIISRVGSGRMGVIYKAEQSSLRRIVALRVLPVRMTSHDDVVAAFQNEARRASTLMHRNAAALIDIGESAGLHFMVTQFIEGDNLADLVAREGRLPEKRAVNITTAMADVLESAHARGILHADIKPANIIVAKDGNPILCDFGLPKQMMLLKGPTAPEGPLGSLAFMSPELDRGAADIDGRSDVYSLGAVLFFMLTGQPPFQGTEEEIRAAREEGPPWPKALVPALSKKICAIIQKSMAAQPGRRYNTAAEMLFALRNHARSLPGAMLARMARAVQLQTTVEPQAVSVPGITSTELPRASAQQQVLSEESAVDLPAVPATQPPLTAVPVPAIPVAPPEDISKRKKRRRVLNAAVGGVGLALLIALAFAGTMYYRGKGRELTPAPEPTTEATEQPVATVPPPPKDVIEKSIANERDVDVAKKLLVEAHSYAFVHPNDTDEIIQRFETVIRVAPKSEQAAQAMRRIEEIKQNMGKQVLQAVDKTIADAEESAAADKFQEAVGKLEQALKTAQPEQKARLETGINDLKRRAGLRFQEFRAKAIELARRGNYPEATRVLESAKVLGVPAVLTQIDEETKKIEEARDTAEVSAIERTMESYHTAMLPILRLAENRSYDEAIAECRKAMERPELQGVKEKIATDLAGIALTRDIYSAVSTSGARFAGRRFTISGISGEIASIKDGVISLKTGYKKPLSALKLTEILSLYGGGAKTYSADEYAKRGDFLMYNGDLDGAAAEFESARTKGANVDAQLDKLRLLRNWRRNDAVEDLLSEIRQANLQGDWKKALEMVQKIKADYADTDAYARHVYDIEDLTLMTRARVDAEARLVLVPAGSFIYQKDEERKLPAFYIDKYEVTNAEYGVFLDYIKKTGDHSFCHPDEPKNKDHTPKDWGKERTDQPNCPVTGVDWFDAYAYARFVGKRLPTEEEWERAARGTSGRSFPWGSSKDDSEWVNSSNADGFAGIAPVDSLPAGESECGCANMMGNAEEWTASWLNETSKSSRAIRGGHYQSPTTITITVRGGYEPTTRTKYTGFRCAKDAPEGKSPRKERSTGG